MASGVQSRVTHWWWFVTVVPLLVALDHGVRWIGEQSRDGNDWVVGLAPLTREDTLFSQLLPPTSFFRTLLAFVAVGLAIHGFGRSRAERPAARVSFVLLAAGALGNWLDQVLFFAATVPIRLVLPADLGAIAFSLGDGYLIASLVFFAFASRAATIPSSDRAHV